MKPVYTISLGHEGDTDVCLMLNRDGESREYSIESDAWKACSAISSHQWLPKDGMITEEFDLWVVANLVWDKYPNEI